MPRFNEPWSQSDFHQFQWDWDHTWDVRKALHLFFPSLPLCNIQVSLKCVPNLSLHCFLTPALKKAINLNFTTSVQNRNEVCSSLWSCQEAWIKWVLLSVWLHETKVGFRSSNKNNSCWLCMLRREEVSEKGNIFPRLYRSSSYSGSFTVLLTADMHLLTAYRAVRSALLRMPSYP